MVIIISIIVQINTARLPYANFLSNYFSLHGAFVVSPDSCYSLLYIKYVHVLYYILIFLSRKYVSLVFCLHTDTD